MVKTALMANKTAFKLAASTTYFTRSLQTDCFTKMVVFKHKWPSSSGPSLNRQRSHIDVSIITSTTVLLWWLRTYRRKRSLLIFVHDRAKQVNHWIVWLRDERERETHTQTTTERKREREREAKIGPLESEKAIACSWNRWSRERFISVSTGHVANRDNYELNVLYRLLRQRLSVLGNRFYHSECLIRL